MGALKDFIDSHAGGMFAAVWTFLLSILSTLMEKAPQALGLCTACFACATGFCVCRHWLRKEFGWFPRKRRGERDEDETDEDAEEA